MESALIAVAVLSSAAVGYFAIAFGVWMVLGCYYYFEREFFSDAVFAYDVQPEHMTTVPLRWLPLLCRGLRRDRAQTIRRVRDMVRHVGPGYVGLTMTSSKAWIACRNLCERFARFCRLSRFLRGTKKQAA